MVQGPIFKDEGYECEEGGIPFLAELGRDVCQYELARKEKTQPDLAQLQALFKEVQ
jgi:hypothetical protein